MRTLRAKSFSIRPANRVRSSSHASRKKSSGLRTNRSRSLIHWAHIIDGALYESPAQCVELRSSALKLMQVIEGEKDPAFVEEIIRMLTEQHA